MHATAFTDGSLPLSSVHLELCRKLRDQAPYRIGPIRICRLCKGVMSVDARRTHPYLDHLSDAPHQPRLGVVRVFLVQDQGPHREAMQELLDATDDIQVIGQASSAREADRHLLERHPHLMVVAGRLPDGSGITVCRDVRAVDPAVQALILAVARDRDPDGHEALFAAVLAGADGYLPEHVEGPALVAAVRQVATGRSLIDPADRRRVLDGIRREVGSHELGSLGAQERRLLGYLAEALSDRQIAHRTHLPESTVRIHVESLLERLGLSGRSVAGLVAAELLS